MHVSTNQDYEMDLLDTAALDAFESASSRQDRGEANETKAIQSIRQQIMADVQRAELKAAQR